ncbi:MAG: glycosyltransferase family 4 protein [Sporichthyaceae bacterium]
MPEPRVLLLLASSTGGVGRHVASVAASLAGHGVAVLVVGPAATDEHFGFSKAGAQFAAVEIADAPRPVQDRAAFRAVRAISADFAPTVVHAHGLRAGGIGVLALGSRRRRPPLVVTLHNAILTTGPRRAPAIALEALVARGADLVLGASGDLVARAERLGARRAMLGPVAAPPPAAFVPEREDARAGLGLGAAPLVVTVGRMAPQKDYPTLLAAARRWLDLVPQPLLGIVGSGPLEGEIRERIAAENLPVHLFGSDVEVSAVLAAADVAVIASHWEARSLFAQEALRAGVPLVSTAVGGIPDLVGEAAILVPRGDAAAVADAVAGVLARPELAALLSVAGRRRAATWPDEAAVQAQLLDLYRGLVRIAVGRGG